MSLQLYLSTLGKRLRIDLGTVTTIDLLRSWIAENAAIQPTRQILMTAKGKNVKQQHLLPDSEIFVYDKSFLSGDAPDETITPPQPEIPEPRAIPTTLANENDLTAWQDLFMARRTWALEVAELIKNSAESVEEDVEVCEVLERCTQVALDNLRNHFAGLEQTAARTSKWAHDTLSDHADVLKEWRDSANTLSELPIREEIARLLDIAGVKGSSDATGTMYGMLDSDSLETAASAARDGSEKFEKELHDFEALAEHLSNDTNEVLRLGVTEWPQVSTDGLIEEAETLAKRISGDYEEVLRSHNDTKSISSISRRALSQTQNILPTMQTLAAEAQQMVQDAYDHRLKLSHNCKEALRQISQIQSRFAGLHSHISALKMEDEGQASLEILDRIFHLPVAYGSTLVEAIRRSEWNERMRTELASLQEDISQQKDDEVRRRRKWATTLGGFLSDDANGNESLIDLNMSTPANKWPFVSREEIFAYIEDLRALGIDDAVEQVTQLLKDLDSVVKTRKPKPKAFKNGSIYDMGQSMVRTGDEVRTLQDDKLRLEDKLRAADSRVRKLEDLLHRSSQLHRPPSGTFTPNTDLERNVTSPGPGSNRPTEAHSRRSSMSLRRLSNQTLDEKAMVQRIVSLEAQITKLQEEAHAERRSSIENRDKMHEAETVKRDLMANFESQRQEFEDERQLLEDDNHKLKLRLEEVEDELDRLLGSRDHQHMTQEQVISNLKADLERVRKQSAEESIRTAKSKDDFLRDIASQRDRVTSLEKSVQQHKDDKTAIQSQNVTLAGRLREMEAQQQDFISSLQAVHSNLSPAGSAPDEAQRLINALEILSEGAAIHARGMDDSLQRVTAERKAQDAKLGSLESQILRLNAQLEHVSKRFTETDEKLSQERSKLSAARSELANEQNELRNLRDKFAAGETGSDALKTRLIEEEKRVAELVELKGEHEAQIERQKHEAREMIKKLEAATAVEQALKLHSERRAQKAKHLSERLFQYNDRIIRMLENIGYSVTRQSDELVIQRASKVNASVMFSTDVGTPMKRTVSGTVPVQHYTEPTDLESLYWTSDGDLNAEEANYQSFTRAISRLDVDGTLEILTKRYKDIETLAKKYQKDSRAYREKTHRLQSEAHEKIAYRSFKEGDLALFLPTRNQATRPWAAFNVGAPHYFLREQDVHRLQSRDWLLARITKVEERVVDLSKSLTVGPARDRASINTENSDVASLRSVDDENPFELSDGLRWYLIDAVEEKPGAPSTPGLGKSTVAASVVEVKGQHARKLLGGKETPGVSGTAANAAKTLTKSLDSRRSSEASRKSGNIAALRQQGSGSSGVQAAAVAATTNAGLDGEVEGQVVATLGPTVRGSDSDVRASGQARDDARMFEIASDAKATSDQRRPPLSRASSSKPGNDSPVKRLQSQQSQSASASKGKSWDKLFSLEYRS